jgi:heat-inducible transcriptional repressor
VIAAALSGTARADLRTWSPATADGASVAVAGIVEATAAELRTALETDDARVFVEGASLLAGSLEARETVEQVLGILEQQFVVVSLLKELVDRGVTVAIGSETGVGPLAECSLVLSPYRAEGEVAGTIAVLGPTRMDYQETVAAVAVVSQRLSRILTEG